MNTRQKLTVIAALRYMQEHHEEVVEECSNFFTSTHPALDYDEIDNLVDDMSLDMD